MGGSLAPWRDARASHGLAIARTVLILPKRASLEREIGCHPTAPKPWAGGDDGFAARCLTCVRTVNPLVSWAIAEWDDQDKTSAQASRGCSWPWITARTPTSLPPSRPPPDTDAPPLPEIHAVGLQGDRCPRARHPGRPGEGAGPARTAYRPERETSVSYVGAGPATIVTTTTPPGPGAQGPNGPKPPDSPRSSKAWNASGMPAVRTGAGLGQDWTLAIRCRIGAT